MPVGVAWISPSASDRSVGQAGEVRGADGRRVEPGRERLGKLTGALRLGVQHREMAGAQREDRVRNRRPGAAGPDEHHAVDAGAG